MTAAEMLTLFRERYNLSSNSNDDKLNDEIYLLFNIAVNRFIKTRFTGNNFRGVQFEKDQKRMDDLRTLIKKTGELAAAVTSIDEIPNGKQYAIPADFMFLIKGYYKISNDWYSAETIESRDSYKYIQTPLNNPFIREGKIFYEDSTNFTILINPDDFANLGVTKIQYIKTPAIISGSINCDLPNHTHEEIVEIAVRLAVEQVENIERFQINNETIKEIE